MTKTARIAFPCIFVAVAAIAVAMPAAAQTADEIETLRVGDTAEDFEFQPLAGDKIKLSEFTEQGPVVLVVLRGFPGYQCPACSGQVAEFRKHAKDFRALKANVVLVYPGERADLAEHAKEFLKGTKLPAPITLMIDPDYSFTKAYGLRWDAPAETAYPSTFVLNGNRKVHYRKVSTSHGDRAKAADVLSAVKKLSPASK